jgi:hypothetical protein
VEVVRLFPEGRVAQGDEPFDVPLLDVGGFGVHIDREVEVVRDVRAGAPTLEDVEAFEDHDVRVADHPALGGHDVVGQVRIHRSVHLGGARLDVSHEIEQSTPVV